MILQVLTGKRKINCSFSLWRIIIFLRYPIYQMPRLQEYRARIMMNTTISRLYIQMKQVRSVRSISTLSLERITKQRMR